MPQSKPNSISAVVCGVVFLLAADISGQSTTITISNPQTQKSASGSSVVALSTTPEAAAKISPDTPIVPLSEIQTRSFSSRALTDGGPQQQQPAQQQPPPPPSSPSSTSTIPQSAKQQLMSTKNEVWTASSGRANGRGKYPSSLVPEETVPYSPSSMYQAPIYKRSEYALNSRGQPTPQNPPPLQQQQQQSNLPPTSQPQVAATRSSSTPQQQPQSRSSSPSQVIGSLIAPLQQGGVSQQQQLQQQQTGGSLIGVPPPPSSQASAPSVQIVVTNRDQPLQQPQQPQQQAVENRLMPQYANLLPIMRPPPPQSSSSAAQQPGNVDNSQQSIPQVIVDVGFPGGGNPVELPPPPPQQQATMYDPRLLSLMAAARGPPPPPLSVVTTTTAAPTIPPTVYYYNDTLDILVNNVQEKISSIVDTLITERDVRRRLELQLLTSQNEIEKTKIQTLATRNDVADMRILLNQLEAELQSVHTVPRLAAASIPQESFALMGQQHVLQQQPQPQQAQQLQLQQPQFLGFPSNNAAEQQNIVNNLQAATNLQALQQQLQLGQQQPQLLSQQQQGAPPPFTQDLVQFSGLLPQQQQLLPVGHPQLLDPNNFLQQQQQQQSQQIPQQQLPQQQLQPPPLQQQPSQGGIPLILGPASAVREELMVMINNLTRRMHEQQFMLTELLNGRIPVHSPDPLIRCHFERTANAGILHHNDKRLIVTDVRECLEACVNESAFLCRSVDFQRSSTKHPSGHTECLLSSRDHLTVPEESFNSYIGWDYFYKVCTPV